METEAHWKHQENIQHGMSRLLRAWKLQCQAVEQDQRQSREKTCRAEGPWGSSRGVSRVAVTLNRKPAQQGSGFNPTTRFHQGLCPKVVYRGWHIFLCNPQPKGTGHRNCWRHLWLFLWNIMCPSCYFSVLPNGPCWFVNTLCNEDEPLLAFYTLRSRRAGLSLKAWVSSRNLLSEFPKFHQAVRREKNKSYPLGVRHLQVCSKPIRTCLANKTQQQIMLIFFLDV